jgi:hypothetical protein
MADTPDTKLEAPPKDTGADLKPGDNAFEGAAALDALAATLKIPAAPAAPAAPAVPAVPAAPAVPAVSVVPVAPAEPAPVVPVVPAVPAAPAEPAPVVSPAPAPAPVAPKDIFSGIELPQNTKSKSAEAFGRIKEVAKNHIAELTMKFDETSAKLAAALKQVGDLSTTKTAIPLETEKELAELRQFKLAKDVTSDPAFKKFDTDITANVDTIYATLKEAGYKDEHIAKIKELGGPDGVDWDPILEKLPVQSRLLVQAKLVENKTLSQGRGSALTAAQANAENYTRERSERENKEVTAVVEAHLKSLDWARIQDIPATATDVQRKEMEAANDVARGASATVQKYLAERSPSRFAELAVGTMLAHRFSAAWQAERASGDATKKDLTSKLDAAVLARDKFSKELEAIKLAQLPRNRGDSIIPPAPVKSALEVTGSENLDRLAREVVAAQREE